MHCQSARSNTHIHLILDAHQFIWRANTFPSTDVFFRSTLAAVHVVDAERSISMVGRYAEWVSSAAENKIANHLCDACDEANLNDARLQWFHLFCAKKSKTRINAGTEEQSLFNWMPVHRKWSLIWWEYVRISMAIHEKGWIRSNFLDSASCSTTYHRLRRRARHRVLIEIVSQSNLRVDQPP